MKMKIVYVTKIVGQLDCWSFIKVNKGAAVNSLAVYFALAYKQAQLITLYS